MPKLKWVSAVSACVLLWSNIVLARGSTKIDPKYLGDYRGLDFLCVQEHLPIEKCTITIGIDTYGVTIERYVGDYLYKFRFNEKLVEPKVEDDMLMIGLAEKTDGAPETWLHFGRSNGVTLPFLMLGPSHTTTGAFYISTDGVDAKLRTEYNDYVEALHGGFDNAAKKIEPLDMDAARHTMASGSRSEKFALLQKAAENLSSGTAEQVTERFELLKKALHDNDAEVRTHAVMPFAQNIWPRQGISLVIEIIQEVESGNADYSESVVGEIINQGVSILEAAKMHIRIATKVRVALGSNDPDEIYQRLKGKATPDQQAYIELASYKFPPTKQFTVSDYEKLFAALRLVSKNKNGHFSANASGAAGGFLTMGRNPFGPCASPLKH